MQNNYQESTEALHENILLLMLRYSLFDDYRDPLVLWHLHIFFAGKVHVAAPTPQVDPFLLDKRGRPPGSITHKLIFFVFMVGSQTLRQ